MSSQPLPHPASPDKQVLSQREGTAECDSHSPSEPAGQGPPPPPYLQRMTETTLRPSAYKPRKPTLASKGHDLPVLFHPFAGPSTCVHRAHTPPK